MEQVEQQEMFRSARILIVDDQEANVRLLEGILKREGYTKLASTTDPCNATSLFTLHRPDLILLDLAMPQLDGFAVMEALRPLIPDQAYLPILVLTADITLKAKRQALSAGAKDFVTKPFDHSEVLLRIRNLLETRFLHLRLRKHNHNLEEKVRERTAELSRLINLHATAQETERRRIAMDLHDGPLQSLAALHVALQAAIYKHEQGEYEQTAPSMHFLSAALDATISDLRAVLADLSLETLDKFGLEAALREHKDRYSVITGIPVTIQSSLPTRLPAHLERLIYRLAQEALSNIRKHAGATAVELSLVLKGDGVEMVIADDGSGFDAQSTAGVLGNAAGEKLGLKSMRERVENAQGVLTIASSPSNGTTLKLWCPVSQPRTE